MLVPAPSFLEPVLRERFGGGQEKESFPEPPRAPARSPGAELEGRAARPLKICRFGGVQLKSLRFFRYFGLMYESGVGRVKLVLFLTLR